MNITEAATLATSTNSYAVAWDDDADSGCILAPDGSMENDGTDMTEAALVDQCRELNALEIDFTDPSTGADMMDAYMAELDTADAADAAAEV